MGFTVENFEYFILIVVRISGFIFTAPFFGMSNVPMRVKAALSIAIGIIMYEVIGYTELAYAGTIGYGMLVIKELMVGLLIGYFSNICNAILSFAGQIIDMEIGFSMVNVLDPVSNIQTTITGNFYSYFVMLILIATNMHHHLLKAITDAFKVIPIGQAIFRPNLYEIMVKFVIDYFIIGFRIVLPIFAATLLVNVILAILAKVAPQMNMFVLGMQLKVFVGLIILFLIVSTLPSVSDFIFNEMRTMIGIIIKSLGNLLISPLNGII